MSFHIYIERIELVAFRCLWSTVIFLVFHTLLSIPSMPEVQRNSGSSYMREADHVTLCPLSQILPVPTWQHHTAPTFCQVGVISKHLATFLGYVPKNAECVVCFTVTYIYEWVWSTSTTPNISFNYEVGGRIMLLISDLFLLIFFFFHSTNQQWEIFYLSHEARTSLTYYTILLILEPILGSIFWILSLTMQKFDISMDI